MVFYQQPNEVTFHSTSDHISKKGKCGGGVLHEFVISVTAIKPLYYYMYLACYVHVCMRSIVDTPCRVGCHLIIPMCN